MNPDEHFLAIALEEARKADWPFGAVLVRNGEILAQAGAGDGKDESIDPTAHAEVNVIRRACTKLHNGNLAGAILYASCEPCALCFGATWYAGIKEIVFGSSLRDIKHIDEAWGGDLGFPHDHISATGISMRGGVLKDEVMKMYAAHPRVMGKSIESIKDRVLLLNINQTYREWMTEEEVLQIAYRAWGVDAKRMKNAEYALAVYQDEVKGVFKIISWYRDKVEPKKWAFEGEIAEESIRSKYIGMRGLRWEQGYMDSFIYVNC